jgi:2-dehydro-3-deoxyphosphogluconate aldolase / (4S)-4-hydroxy-2-oxoglutarate aldolase
MDKVFERIGLIGIIPVVTMHRADAAVPLANALVNGGLPCVEVTFRTDAAKEAISQISKAGLPLLIGAGTVQSVNQVKEAVDCGAQFIVSPGLNQNVVEYCVQAKIPIMPGASTPTEFEQAMNYGLEVLKFFPAEASGGVGYLEAISAPYKKVRFVPTGGIDETNLLSYLKLPGVLACGGSWMVRADLIANRKVDEIQMLSAKAVKTMLGLRLKHIGINSPNAEVARTTAAFLGDLLQFEQRDTPGSIFLGSEFEILKSPLYGEHGHIAIGTNFIERAIAYLDRKGIRTKPETRFEKDGKFATVYLDVDIGGFAVHLIQT